MRAGRWCRLPISSVRRPENLQPLVEGDGFPYGIALTRRVWTRKSTLRSGARRLKQTPCTSAAAKLLSYKRLTKHKRLPKFVTLHSRCSKAKRGRLSSPPLRLTDGTVRLHRIYQLLKQLNRKRNEKRQAGLPEFVTFQLSSSSVRSKKKFPDRSNAAVFPGFTAYRRLGRQPGTWLALGADDRPARSRST